ncbi:hypothetical protein ALI144C_44860 [Actinosynnema sp. ALI-1.44]|uniref:phage major capsid protein n=1 Tax=Actinosynnema sp. ALI-1.44 TaxID=1933779 RepID=UPI00097C6993|nr:phage major capsid protein [Actinosynnema sp. ALI-1.44]ONI73085.1 hypothetical protein ALI144C_44860 [Actinosynnema sp. ALI-1.44]
MTVEGITAAMTAIIDGAEGRDLTDKEVADYEQLEAQLQAAQRSAQVRARQAAYNAVAPAVHVAPARTDDSPEAAFRGYMRTGKANGDLVAAQSEGIGSEGGYLVPEGFRMKIIEKLKKFGGIEAAAEPLETETGATLPWPTVDDTGNEGEVVDEGGTFVSGADVEFGTNGLGAYTYQVGGSGGNALRIPRELMQDAAFDVEGLVSRLLAVRLRRLQARHLVRGNGVKQPLGLVFGLTGIEIGADTAGVTYNDLVNFEHAVDPAYRELGNCKWGMNDKSLREIKKIADSHGDPIFRPANADLATGTGGGTLMGYPVVIDQAFPDIVANDNQVNWGAFGDFREGYVVRRVRDIEVVVNPWTRANNRQIEITAWARMDATQQNTGAYVALTGEET